MLHAKMTLGVVFFTGSFLTITIGMLYFTLLMLWPNVLFHSRFYPKSLSTLVTRSGLAIITSLAVLAFLTEFSDFNILTLTKSYTFFKGLTGLTFFTSSTGLAFLTLTNRLGFLTLSTDFVLTLSFGLTSLSPIEMACPVPTSEQLRLPQGPVWTLPAWDAVTRPILASHWSAD